MLRRSRENNYDKYRLQNNKDVSNHYAKKKLTTDAAAKVISDNIKKYLDELNNLKQTNRN